MAPDKFIENKLSELVDKFPQIKVRYEYDEMCSLHTIEVLPKEIYNNNSDYQCWEEYVIFEFIDIYPEHNISFITDGALVPIGEIEVFEANGSEHHLPTVCLDTWGFNSDLMLEGLFDNFSPQIYKSIKIDNCAVNMDEVNNLQNITYNISCGFSVFSDKPEVDDLINSDKEKTEYSNAGENQFALAA